MKKTLSVLLSFVMLFTTLTAIPVTAQAAQKYDSRVIDANIDYIKEYVKNNGFINGNGKYTLQDSGTLDGIDYYGLFLLNPADNLLTLEYQLYYADTDDLFSSIELEISYTSMEIMKTDVDFWMYSSDYSDIDAYAYLDKNFNHNTKTPAFYINSNTTYLDDYEAADMCENVFSLAFDEWEYMLEDFFGMNLSVLGFHSYCTQHTYGYNGDSCVFCGAYKPAPAKPKSTNISKLIAGKKQFKASWKKVSGVTGYQIQYSTDKKFKKNTKTVTIKKNNTTSSVIKKLSGNKKYYVRIRTYKNAKSNGKTVKVYSSWSKTKSVKVK